MKEKLNLSISNPCSEKFEQFQTTKAGGFCNSCQKEVIDFSSMSDREVLNYFKNREEKTCGRFHNSQLKMYAETTSPRERRGINFIGASLLSFSLLSFLSSTNLQAQSPLQKVEVQSLKDYEIPNKQSASSKNEDGNIVEGIVLNEEGEPLVGASVLLKGTFIGIFTNDEGKFTFPEPLKAGDILVVSYVGYKAYDFKIEDSNQPVISLKASLLTLGMVMMGEVAVDQVYTSKPTFWQKVKGVFK